VKRFWVVCAVLATSFLSARAEDSSKRARVQELFAVMHISQMTDAIVASVRKQMDTSVRSMPGMEHATPEQSRLLNEYEGKVLAMVNDTVSWKVLEPQMADLYAATYSDDEINGLLAFYKGPVGQALLAKTPELTQKSLEISQSRLLALQPQVNELMKNFVRDFSAASQPPSGADKGVSPPKAAPTPAPSH
jgi:uncharacterized protein